MKGRQRCGALAPLEVWPETRFSPSWRFLNVDWRCNSGFLKRIAYTTMPYKTGLRLLGVARNPANGFPARLLGMDTRAKWWDYRFLYERFNCKPIPILGVVRGSRYRGRGCLGGGGRRTCGASDVG